MSTFFLGLFHGSPLCNDCFSENCKRTNHRKNSSMKEINLAKVVACIPILCGQVLGIMIFKSALNAFETATDFQVKVSGVANMLRGVLTFLGLGIVCLLVDILVTLALLIKKCLREYC